MPMPVLFWVWFCAYLNCAGWALSALHQLNAGGYAVTLLIGFAALLIWRKKNSRERREVCEGEKTGASSSSRPLRDNLCFHRFRHRFRKLFPLAFLILGAISFLGGAIYAPTNYDALAYRIPRILHWLAADQWHWIHTIFPRVNNRSCGIEWVSAPFIALFKTDRFLFLINFISFVFLPGLVFSVFTRLGVLRRVAWHWMWIAPTGYCFLLQAGSVGNDLFGAVFALAAVDFALRAKISGSSRDIFASVLAAALMTSAKLSSLPLLLPWAIALLPSLKLFFRWPVRTVVVCIIAIFASGLPTMILNAKFSDDWSGAGLKHGNVKHAAILKTGANAGLLALQNLEPPVFPFTAAWDHEISNLVPASVTLKISDVMVEPRAASFSTDEMQMEENAGLGFGVSALFLVSAAGAVCARRKKSASGVSVWLICVRWSPVISLLAVMAQSNLSGIGRILTPYYLLLLPPLLACGGHEPLIKRSWWSAAASAVFLLAAGLLIISPARPLFPIQTILRKIQAPDSHLLARVKEVYSVYGNRNDGFAPARDILPPDLKVLGIVTFDDPETSLWRPFGTRSIEHVRPGDTAADLKARGITYILLREQIMGWFNCPLDVWLKQMNAQVVKKIPLDLRASSGPLVWDLVKLN
jgi:hypothetical protein